MKEPWRLLWEWFIPKATPLIKLFACPVLVFPTHFPVAEATNTQGQRALGSGSFQLLCENRALSVRRRWSKWELGPRTWTWRWKEINRFGSAIGQGHGLNGGARRKEKPRDNVPSLVWVSNLRQMGYEFHSKSIKFEISMTYLSAWCHLVSLN